MRKTAEIFKALGDDTRLRILNLLSDGELCVCELMQVLEVGQSKASRHLAVLRQVELVSDRREGMWMYYSLAEPQTRTQRWVLDWLESAPKELPQAATDLGVLKKLRRSGGLCGPVCAERRRTVPKRDAVMAR